MKKSNRPAILLAILIASVLPRISFAGDDAIAPFLDAQTDIVVHVDLSRLDLDAVNTWLQTSLDNSKLHKPQIDQIKQAMLKNFAVAKDFQARFEKAGGKDGYIFFTFSDWGNILTVIPLGHDADPDALVKLLSTKETLPGTTAVIGNNLVAGPQDRIQKLKNSATGRLRPDLTIPLSINPDAPIHIAISATILSGIKAMLEHQNPPEVLAQLKSTRWAASTMTMPPQASFSATIQCNDAEAASLLAAYLNNQIDRMKQSPTAAQISAGHLDQLIAALKPTRTGDKLSISLDQQLLGIILPELLRDDVHFFLIETAPITPEPTTRRANPKNICYVCNGAGSLAGPKGDVLRRELKNAIVHLSPIDAFNILIFHDTPDHKSFESLDTQCLIPSPQNIRKCSDFLDKSTFQGKSNPIPALEEAWRENPRLVYLLTDGQFKDPDTAAVMAKIKELNDARQKAGQRLVKVYTILIVQKRSESYPDFEAQMKKIADDNDGIYVKCSAEDLN